MFNDIFSRFIADEGDVSGQLITTEQEDILITKVQHVLDKSTASANKALAEITRQHPVRYANSGNLAESLYLSAMLKGFFMQQFLHQVRSSAYSLPNEDLLTCAILMYHEEHKITLYNVHQLCASSGEDAISRMRRAHLQNPLRLFERAQTRDSEDPKAALNGLINTVIKPMVGTSRWAVMSELVEKSICDLASDIRELA